MNKQFKKEMIIHLRLLGNRMIKPQTNYYGICGEVYRTIGMNRGYVNSDSIIADCAESWLKYSKDRTFPVPHKTHTNDMAYMNCKNMCTNMWDARTTYGKDRLELCLHIADELEKELSDDESNS